MIKVCSPICLSASPVLFVGGSLASLLDFHYEGWLGNLLVATIGAILLLWVWRRFRGAT